MFEHIQTAAERDWQRQTWVCGDEIRDGQRKIIQTGLVGQTKHAGVVVVSPFLPFFKLIKAKKIQLVSFNKGINPRRKDRGKGAACPQNAG